MQQNITYLNYPKQFNRYTWFKPLMVTLVALGFYLAFSIVLSIVCYVLAANQGIDLTDIMNGGYDKLGWFDRAKKDDVAKFNAAYPPKEKTN